MVPVASRVVWRGSELVVQALPRLVTSDLVVHGIDLVATRLLELAIRVVQQHNDRAIVLQFVSGILGSVREWGARSSSGSIGETMLQLWQLGLNLGPPADSELVAEGAVRWAVQLGWPPNMPWLTCAAQFTAHR